MMAGSVIGWWMLQTREGDAQTIENALNSESEPITYSQQFIFRSLVIRSFILCFVNEPIRFDGKIPQGLGRGKRRKANIRLVENPQRGES